MTWQEELRRLDEDFSSGNITADEYRVRRDQVLSSAVAPQPPAQQAPSPADGGQPGQAQQGQQSAEETQIVPPVSYESANPDATQVVRSSDVGPPTPMYHPGGELPQAYPQEWHQGPPSGGFPQQGPPSGGFAQQGPPSGGFPQQGPPSGGFEQQSPPAYGAPSPPYGFPAQPQQQWGGQAQAEDQDLLWGGQELPAAAPPTDDWVTQGPEDESDSKGGAGKIIVVVVAVLLVAGAAFGAWWFWLRGDDEPQAQPPGGTSQTQAPTQEPTTPPTTTTQPLPQPPAAKDREAKNADNLIDAPGKKRGGGKFALKDLAENQYLPTDVVAALKEAKMSEGLLLATKDGSVNIGLYSVQVKDESKIVDVAKAYTEVQDNGGVPMDRELSMQGVPAFTNSSSAKEAVFRAVYVVHDRVVIVETFGKDREAAQSQFDSILSEQVDHAPPTELNWYE